MAENQEGEEAMLYDEEDEIAVDEGLAVRKGHIAWRSLHSSYR